MALCPTPLCISLVLLVIACCCTSMPLPQQSSSAVDVKRLMSMSSEEIARLRAEIAAHVDQQQRMTAASSAALDPAQQELLRQQQEQQRQIERDNEMLRRMYPPQQQQQQQQQQQEQKQKQANSNAIEAAEYTGPIEVVVDKENVFYSERSGRVGESPLRRVGREIADAELTYSNSNSESDHDGDASASDDSNVANSDTEHIEVRLDDTAPGVAAAVAAGGDHSKLLSDTSAVFYNDADVVDDLTLNRRESLDLIEKQEGDVDEQLLLPTPRPIDQLPAPAGPDQLPIIGDGLDQIKP